MGMRVHNGDSFYKMFMIKKSDTPEKPEKKNKKKILRNINA